MRMETAYLEDGKCTTLREKLLFALLTWFIVLSILATLLTDYMHQLSF